MSMPIKAAAALAIAGSMLLGACGSSGGSEGSGGGSGDTTLSIVGFAVPEAANKAIAEEWNTTPERRHPPGRRRSRRR
jgi:ABC-type glycerol-3-phosphate transport system substrate-binding protein